jgi:hypothetical protein
VLISFSIYIILSHAWFATECFNIKLKIFFTKNTSNLLYKKIRIKINTNKNRYVFSKHMEKLNFIPKVLNYTCLVPLIFYFYISIQTFIFMAFHSLNVKKKREMLKNDKGRESE